MPISAKEKTNPQLISLEEAAALIQSEDSIWVGSGFSIPNLFLDKLADRYETLHDVTVLGINYMNYSKIMDSKYVNIFHVISFFESAMFRIFNSKAENIEYIKKPYRPYSKTICEQFKTNTMVVEVCPPDENGFCNVGATGKIITPYLNNCESIVKKIAVINEFQRPAFDDGDIISIHLSDFDYVCNCNHNVFKRTLIK
ncbi:MAG: hypothetical protein GX488_09360 [Clostridiales bacterium]|nr:hypothetical protein [Clostridiales bacterium]